MRTLINPEFLRALESLPPLSPGEKIMASKISDLAITGQAILTQEEAHIIAREAINKELKRLEGRRRILK